MPKIFLMLAVIPFLLGACAASSSHGVDPQADSQLGVEAEDQNQSANTALQQLQKMQAQEQRKQLERQITDPSSGINR